MQMSFRSGLFVVRTYSREDGVIAKQAGARWHGGHDDPRWPASKCEACATKLPFRDYWYFAKRDAARAIQLEAIADESALAALRPATALLEVSRSAGTEAPRTAAAEELLERDVPIPAGRKLYPYQKTGVLFMSKNKEGSLLADEQGLGKTAQVLALINLEQISRTLVVCPASLRLNWLREAVMWLVRPMRIHVVTDSEKTAANVKPGKHRVTSGPDIPKDIRENPPENLIVIANYDRIREGATFEDLEAIGWDLLASDEAHFLKNPKAQRTIAMLGKEEKGKMVARGLRQRASRFIAMTGTPLPNRPVEMWPILHAVAPKTFSDFWAYARRYCNAQKIWISPRVGAKWDFAGSSHLDELQEVLRSTCMLRRLKADVLTDLPPKVRQIIALPYEDYADVVKAEYGEQDLDEDDVEGLVDGLISDGTPEAYEEAATALGTMGKMGFSEMSRARQKLAVKKLGAVIEICDNRLEEMGETGKIIIFAHHHAVIEKLSKHYGAKAVTFYGKTPDAERFQAVQRFQEDPSVRVFIGSIASAGTGLTLTAATTVVFAEIDWTPGNVVQAEDRAHRIGQKDSVTVLHIVVERSLDARMVQLLVAKADIADRALDRGRPELVIPTNEALEKREQEKREHALRYPPISKRLVSDVQEMMGILTAMDADHAAVVNGEGFSKLDGGIGRRVALAKDPGPGIIWGIGVKLAQKYRRQVPSLAEEIAIEAARLREGWVAPVLP